MQKGTSSKRPKVLDQKDLRGYDLIVAMEPRQREAVVRRCLECAGKTVVWNIEDPYYMSPGSSAKIYDEIGRKVEELALTL